MMSADSLFAEAVQRAFSCIQHGPTELTAGWGPIGCRLLFTDEVLARSYSQSFRPLGDKQVEFSVAVLTGDTIDLSGILPIVSHQGRTYFSKQCVVVWHPDPLSVLYILDRQSRRGVVWLPAGSAPEWELSRPACPLLHATVEDTAWSAIHGAAVARAGRLLLLAGKGRAGKSTAALACMRSGWDYAGDDYVCAETESGRVEPLYVSARLRADMVGALTDIIHTTSAISHDLGESRHELRLSKYLSADRVRGGQLAAILIPRRRGAQRPEFEAATRAEALQALFLTTAQGMPGSVRVIGRKLSRLVGQAPAFFVDTGADVTAIPDAFGTLLRTLN